MTLRSNSCEDTAHDCCMGFRGLDKPCYCPCHFPAAAPRHWIDRSLGRPPEQEYKAHIGIARSTHPWAGGHVIRFPKRPKGS